jgi:drug/metabolite transporter (DMT)-like permease
MRPAYLIILLVLNFFWAAGLSAYKVVEQYLEPGGIVTLRFGLAGLSVWVLWPWLPGVAPRGRDLAKTCLLGLIVFVLGHRLQVLGNKLGTATNSSILMAIEPLITTMGAALFLRESIGPRRLIGFVFGMSGVVLLHGPWRPEFHWLSLGASVIFIGSFFCETAYSIIGKKIINPTSGGGALAAEVALATGAENPKADSATSVTAPVTIARQQNVGAMKVLALSLAVGTLVNLLIDGPTTFVAARQMPAHAWLLILGMALICTSFGYGFWFLVIREGEVNVAALTIFAQPIFGVALARLWLGETLHWGQLWGSVAIVVGLVLGLSRQIRRIPV